MSLTMTNIEYRLPGLDSQTTSDALKDIFLRERIDLEELYLSFFLDIPTAEFSPSLGRDWSAAAEEILKDYAELWNRLAEV